MNYTPSANWLKLLLLGVPVIGWGLWPLFRTNCGAPVLTFAPINILSQFCTACVYALIFEGPYRIYDTWKNFDVRVGFAVLGGFLLGHGDHCSALGMRFLRPGLTLALVSIVNVVLTCVFNYIQVGALRPDYVFTGLGFAVMAIIFLSQTVQKSSKKEPKEDNSLETYRFFSESSEQVYQKKTYVLNVAGHNSSLIAGSKTEDGYKTFSNGDSGDTPEAQLTISKRQAFAIVAVAGLFTACWGPMSTYARDGSLDELIRSPGIILFFYTLGELLALPDIYLICFCIEPQPKYILTRRRLLWGIVTGVSVSSGYFFYFTATYNNMDDIVVPASVIVQCNSLVAVITDVLQGEFNGASVKTKVLLAGAVMFYIGAVLMNAFSI